MTRHAVIFCFPSRCLVELFRNFGGDCEYLSVPRIKWDIPDDAEVRDVQYEFDSGCVAVLVEHPTFPEVDEGERPTRVYVEGYEVVRNTYRREVGREDPPRTGGVAGCEVQGVFEPQDPETWLPRERSGGNKPATGELVSPWAEDHRVARSTKTYRVRFEDRLFHGVPAAVAETARDCHELGDWQKARALLSRAATSSNECPKTQYFIVDEEPASTPDGTPSTAKDLDRAIDAVRHPGVVCPRCKSDNVTWTVDVRADTAKCEVCGLRGGLATFTGNT